MTELNISEISFQISNVIETAATIDGRGSKERQFFTMNYISLLTFFLLSNSFAAFLFAQLIQLLFRGNKLYGQKKWCFEQKKLWDEKNLLSYKKNPFHFPFDSSQRHVACQQKIFKILALRQTFWKYRNYFHPIAKLPLPNFHIACLLMLQENKIKDQHGMS